MRRFKSTAHAQRFLSVHGIVRNLFRVGRHLLRAVHSVLRTRSFLVWNDVTLRVLESNGSPTSKGSSRAILVNLTVLPRATAGLTAGGRTGTIQVYI